MIPRRFFWLFDLLILSLTFLVAYSLFPFIQPLFTPGGLLPLSWIQRLAAPASSGGQLPPLTDFAWIFLAMTVATLFSLQQLGVYSDFFVKQSYFRLVGGSLLAALIGLSLVTLAMFALKSPSWSRLFVFSFGLLAGLSLGLYRVVVRLYLYRRRMAGYYMKNILLIGAPTGLAWLTRYFAEHIPAAEYRLLGYLGLETEPESKPGETSTDTGETRNLELQSLGNVQELGRLLIQRPIHEVVAIQPVTGGEWLDQVIWDCDRLGILVRIVPETLRPEKLQTLRVLYPLDPLPLPAVTLKPPHQETDALFFKRVFDLVVSASLLLLLSPLFLLIALAIKLTTPHLSVFYPWRVVGRNGVEFTGYKFTTMIPEADTVKAQLLQYNEMTGPVFKIKEDPRVTPLGRFLRKYSLNELPQLWSVFVGDMSLVGPRPAFRHELDHYEFWHKRKLSVRPGMTCLWQVRGRNKISNFDDWVKMDLEYIDNWSLWLDLKILAMTAWAVVAGTGS